MKNTEDVADDDDITRHVRGRMLCSMDCCWRIFGFQTYPASDPPVTLIKAKSESAMEYDVTEAQLSDMAVYFKRPHEAAFTELLYTEFFSKYAYSAKLPAYAEKGK